MTRSAQTIRVIVYGDPSHEATLAELLADFRFADASPDGLRRLLIQAGCLEQAVMDKMPELAPLSEAVTDAVARVFLGKGELTEVQAALRRVPASDVSLTVKTPEGFAFYSLYPEAYVEAARRWRAEHPRESAVVVGVRSIGTTLSAVVAAELGARRLTVRPTGHPFAREVTIEDLPEADWAIVVDEGPGLSGSSMASVAEALVRTGHPGDRIAFFPGHGGGPGRQASKAVRAWWREVPRYVVPLEALRWDGKGLLEILAEATRGDVTLVEDLTGGVWREALGDPATWPGVVGAFERPKLRVFRRDGSSVLWKFVGLTVEGATLGFRAEPWIEGEALRREDVTPGIVARIGEHIVASAGPPLSPTEAKAARARLVEMLRVNGEEAGLEVRLAFLSTQPPLQDEPLEEGEPSAGDYRLAPWEWRRLPDGRIVMAGRIAPTLDHTVVGRQPLAWDVAGAMVEWGLDDPAGLPQVEDLPFYIAAYAAFRMGMCLMFAGDDPEGERLRRDAAFYRSRLEAAMQEG